MAKRSVANELAKHIRDLRAQRREHLQAIEEIDQTFTSLGIDPEGDGSPIPGRRGRKAGSKAKGVTRRGRRGSYKQTAEQFIVGLLEGGRKLRTSEINAKWTAAKRGGSANNTLSKMTKSGQLRKENIPGSRGSLYSAA